MKNVVEKVMEQLCSSPFMGRWREAPERLCRP